MVYTFQLSSPAYPAGFSAFTSFNTFGASTAAPIPARTNSAAIAALPFLSYMLNKLRTIWAESPIPTIAPVPRIMAAKYGPVCGKRASHQQHTSAT